MNHEEGISIFKAAKKNLTKYINEEFEKHIWKKVIQRENDITADRELKKKLIFIKIDDEFRYCASKVAIEGYKEMEPLFGKYKIQVHSWLWHGWIGSWVSCLKQAWKKLAKHMLILSISCKNIWRFLVFFEDAKCGEILTLLNITCWGDNNKMFELLHHLSSCSTKVVKWEFEVKEGWLPSPEGNPLQNDTN